MRGSQNDSALLEDRLQAAICMLALVTERPRNLDNVVSKSRADHQSVDKILAEDSDINADIEDLVVESAISNDEGNTNDQLYLASLRNAVLDRLAEVLARFKTDRTAHNGPILDPKHVSAAFMVIRDGSSKVDIYCAKNEGLDQQIYGEPRNTRKDTVFLEAWARNMQCIAEKAAQAKLDLFDLIVEYQRPRLVYYVNRLRQVLLTEPIPRFDKQPGPTTLSYEQLSKIELPRSPRSWVDDNGNRFKIPNRAASRNSVPSTAAVSGESLLIIDNEIDSVLTKIDALCQFNLSSRHSFDFTKPQKALLQDTMEASLRLWRSVRHESAIKARLRDRFSTSADAAKRVTIVITALRFLCRTQLAVATFIEASEMMPMFQSIRCIPVGVPPKSLRPNPTRRDPMEVLKSMGINDLDEKWIKYIQEETTVSRYHDSRMHPRFLHAELQILNHCSSLRTTREESAYVHPYIGCSKLCCLLCYCFVSVHGKFSMRGTHRTVMHRWELPPAVEHRPAAERLFNIVVDILKYTVQKPFSERHDIAIAQSSAAMSTARTVPDYDLGQMEQSQGDISRFMMMPSVTEHGLLIHSLTEKPGYAHVIGGGLQNSREMTLQDADIFSANYYRSKFGFEKLNDRDWLFERPKSQSMSRHCSCCRLPAKSYCSACRTPYCSQQCQRKDWNRHVFLCTIPDRPNDFDHLKYFLSRNHMLRNERDRSIYLNALYSDDHLCRTFGFVNCADHEEVMSLLCIWHNLKLYRKDIARKIARREVDLGCLVEIWAKKRLSRDDKVSAHHSHIQWFLDQRNMPGGFRIPEWERHYAYQIDGTNKAKMAFSIDPKAEHLPPMTAEELTVFVLYTRLFRPFNNIPDASTSEWLNFGFHACKTSRRRTALATQYLKLADTGASLTQIADAWMTSTLPALFTSHNMRSQTFHFAPPDHQDFGIYRLMAEISHTLSGLHCPCFKAKQDRFCHSKNESHLSIESEIEFGFHGTNAWERWQLMNFYKHVFEHQGFDAQAMLSAKRQGRAELEGYLEGLTPGWRMKIANRVLADVMFPKLGSRVEWTGEVRSCRCVVHDVWVPEGLDWLTPHRVRGVKGQEDNKT